MIEFFIEIEDSQTDDDVCIALTCQYYHHRINTVYHVLQSGHVPGNPRFIHKYFGELPA